MLFRARWPRLGSWVNWAFTWLFMSPSGLTTPLRSSSSPSLQLQSFPTEDHASDELTEPGSPRHDEPLGSEENEQPLGRKKRKRKPRKKTKLFKTKVPEQELKRIFRPRQSRKILHTAANSATEVERRQYVECSRIGL